MKKTFFRFWAVLAFLVYSSNILFAADYAKSFMDGRRTLGAYLERAAEQSDKSRFERMAREGVEAALFEWERNTLDLKLFGLEEWEAQKNAFERDLGEEAQAACERWLLERMALDDAALKKSALYEELQKAAEDFFYTDQAGNKSRVVSKKNIKGAREQWEETAQKIVQKYFEDDCGEGDAAALCFAEQKICNALMNELLYDHSSLKKISDSQAAAVIADNLALQIEGESERAVARLFDSLETEAKDAGSQDVKASQENLDKWLGRFESELKAGLKKWEDAEIEFLTARSEWEMEAQSLYSDDVQKWQAAYQELQDRKSAWTKKIAAQIEDGEREWQKKFSGLYEEIAAYMQEFQNSVALESGQKESLVDAQIMAYKQSRAVVQTAQSGIDNWYASWALRYNGVYSYWKTEDAEFGRNCSLSSRSTYDLKNEALSWKRDFIKSVKAFFSEAETKFTYLFILSKGGYPYTLEFYTNMTKTKELVEQCSENSSYEQIESLCRELYSYKRHFDEDEIDERYWECLCSGGAMWYAQNELFEWLDLADKFKAKASEYFALAVAEPESDLFVCDDLSREKAKAEYLYDSWESKARLYQAVFDYSQNPYSDIESAARTQENLDAAIAKYEAADAEYRRLLELSKQKGAQVEAARDNYALSVERAQEAMKALEAAEKEYDSIVDEGSQIYSMSYYDTVYELVVRFQSLNVDDDDFEKLLLAYAAKESAKENDEFLDLVRAVRENVENGSGELSCDFSIMDGADLGEDVLAAKESVLALDVSSSRTLSMLRLEELSEGLESLLASEPFDKAAANSFLDDLAVLDREGALALKESVEGLEDGDEAGEETLELVEALHKLACDELKNREAALLLIDGSSEEIHEFFEQNPGLENVLDRYGMYSEALAQERQKEAKAAVAKAMQTAERFDIEKYFKELDLASDGLSAGDAAALELYKKAFRNQKENSFKENMTVEKIIELFPYLNASGIKYYLQVYEEYFCGESAAACDFDFDQEAFFEIINGRSKILSQIQDAVDTVNDPSAKRQELLLRLIEQDAVIKNLRSECEAAVAQASDISPNSAISLYASLCDEYNQALDDCSIACEKLKAARFDRDVAEEIYFYGQNEYLRANYGVQEKLEKAKSKRDEFKKQLDALNAVELDLPCELLDSYKRSYVEYYKSRALVYKYEKEVAAQKQRLYMAQEEERKALEYIVREVSQAQNGFVLPAAVKDLVRAEELPDGSYSFRLSAGAGADSQANEALLVKYFTEMSVLQTDVYGTEYWHSKARQDAIDFLDSLEAKPYTITDLALAAMQAKVLGGVGLLYPWDEQNEDPRIDAYYKIGDLPDVVHAVDLADAYHSGRMNMIGEAYWRVLLLGGEEDIAKFILFSKVNLSQGLRISDLQNNYLRYMALERPIDQVNDAALGWQIGAAANFALAAVFTAIAMIPFVGSWAEPVAACFTAIGASFQAVALKLWETASDIQEIKSGYIVNYSEAQKSYAKIFSNLNELREKRQKETESLNVLLSGKEDAPSGTVTWEAFDRAVRRLFEEDSSDYFKNYVYSMNDPASGEGGLKEFFYEVTRGESFESVGAVIEKMSLLLRQKRSVQKERMESLVFDGASGDSVDAAAVCNDLISFYSKELLPSLPVNFGEGLEDYQEEAVSDWIQLRAQAIESSAKNKLLVKEALFETLIEDASLLRENWEEKSGLVLSAAQDEWKDAEARLESGFELWAEEWNSKYAAADEEWKASCRDFLDAKEKWISRQYLNATVDQDIGWSFDKSALSAALPKARVEAYVDSLNDSQKFERCYALAQKLSDFAKDADFSQSLFLSERMDGSLLKNLDKTMNERRALQSQMEDAAAKCAAQSAKAQLEKILDERFDLIDRQNSSLERWELDMVRASGYTVDPLIHRNAIIDSSFVSVERETQWVHRYEWFVARRPELKLDLTGRSGTQSHFIMKKLEELQLALQNWTTEIFGSEGGSSGGKFGEHVGKAPAFKDNVDPRLSLDRNVLDYGSGQMGLIMLDYQWNAIRNSSGYAELSKAVYDQQLFDLGIDGLKLPTLRDVTGIVCEIVSSCTPFVFMKYVDDIVFGTVDLAMGFKTWSETLESALKQAATGASASVIGAAAGAIGSSIKSACSVLQNGPAGAIFDAAQKAAAGYASNVTANYINALDFASGRIDWEKASGAWIESGALSGLVGGLAGGVLAAVDSFDSQGLLLNQEVFCGRANLNSTVGALAGEAAAYLTTGDFSVNLLGINGVGLFELGIHDGEFSAGIGRGGAYLSLDKLDAAASELESVAKVQKLKDAGTEDRAALTVANLLGWSGGSENLSLAKDLFSGGRALSFGQGAQATGASLSMDSALLDQGKSGLVTIAALASYQNLAQKDLDLSSMAQVAAAVSTSAKALGVDSDSIEELSSFAAMTKAYKQGGMAGVYALYAEVQKRADEDGQKRLTLASLMEQPWFQNEAQNIGIALGESLSVQDYNKAARQNAIERHAAAAVKAFCVEHPNEVSEAKIKEVESEARAQAEREIVEGVANQKYSYKPETKVTDIYSFGCTLATAAYIAYSITGKAATLSEANQILVENNLFLEGTDEQGVKEKNRVDRGDGYANAVNAIAGGDYLQKDGKDYSVSAVDQRGRDNRQSIFDRLLQSQKAADEVYFTHMRVNNTHSVLFDSLAYSDAGDYKSSTLVVMDPWRGGKYGPKSWSDISRADFYKLTQTGKDLYKLTQLRSRLQSA